MKASFPSDRFPAARLEEADGSIRFVLKDGVEIHRIGPPTEVYSYDTGKLVGHAGPTGRLVPLVMHVPITTRAVSYIARWMAVAPDH